MNRQRAALLVGVVVLVATAGLHLTGYSEVTRHASSTALPTFWRQAVKASWVFFSVQLMAIAAAAAIYGLRTPPSRDVLRVMICMLVGNLLVLIAFMGIFAGAVLIALATGALAIGERTMRR
jgi:hypothetical protein